MSKKFQNMFRLLVLMVIVLALTLIILVIVRPLPPRVVTAATAGAAATGADATGAAATPDAANAGANAGSANAAAAAAAAAAAVTDSTPVSFASPGDPGSNTGPLPGDTVTGGTVPATIPITGIPSGNTATAAPLAEQQLFHTFSGTAAPGKAPVKTGAAKAPVKTGAAKAPVKTAAAKAPVKTGAARVQAASSAITANRLDGQYIVLLHPNGVNFSSVDALVAAYGINTTYNYRHIFDDAYGFAATLSQAQREQLAANQHVASILPDVMFHMSALEQAPLEDSAAKQPVRSPPGTIVKKPTKTPSKTPGKTPTPSPSPTPTPTPSPSPNPTPAPAPDSSLGNVQISWGLTRVCGCCTSRNGCPTTVAAARRLAVSGDAYIVDTGIDPSHPDLNVVESLNYVSWELTTNDLNGHGSHVAGIVGARGKVLGVAPGVRLHSLRVLDSTGSGAFSSVLAALDYIISLKSASPSKHMVVNMSFGANVGTPDYTELDMKISNAIANNNLIVCCAAGNESSDATSTSPAHVQGVFTIASYGATNRSSTFTNFGSIVDYYAPGENIKSTYKNQAYATLSGTSMATPFVTGSALLWLAGNPSNISPSSFQSAMNASAANPVNMNISGVPAGTTPKSIYCLSL